MKKIFNYLLVIALVLVQFIPVVEAAKITVNNSVNGQTYNAYKIFDVTKSESGNYAYSIDKTSPWFSIVEEYALNNTDTFTLKRVGTTDKYVVTPGEKFTEEDHAKAFAAYLNNKKGTIKEDGSAKATGETVDIEVKEAGYYFVDSSLGALCALHTAADKITVEEKNTKPTIKKEASQETAGVGEEVTFTITVTAGGAADTSYIVRDTMTEGLDLVVDSVEITVGEEEVSESNYIISTSAHGFVIEFNNSYTAALEKGTEIVITYNAVVNKNAISEDSVTNEAKLEYGQSSTVEKVTLNNYDFELVKTDETGKELTGAKFKLYDARGNEILLVLEEGSYRPAMVGENGVEIEAGRVMINGLSSGTYYLEETKAPEGYNQLTSRFEFEIEDADLIEDAAVVVENTTGTILPSTGGMGTVLFLVIGSIMVIGFGVLLVTKLRMAKMSI